MNYLGETVKITKDVYDHIMYELRVMENIVKQLKKVTNRVEDVSDCLEIKNDLRDVEQDLAHTVKDLEDKGREI